MKYVLKRYQSIMKKSILFLLLVAGMATLRAAEPQKTTVNVATQQTEKAAEIKFETLTHDFGTFTDDNPVVKCLFKFTNVGDAPLIINQAIASCGCTVPTYTKDPIKPGESGQIEVTYNGKGKFPGRFTKNITVRSNAKETGVVRLTISGNMTKAEGAPKE
jgi:hypothetical protein